MLSAVESCPCNPARILTLQEERFGLATLKTEDLAITTNVEFSLKKKIIRHDQLAESIARPMSFGTQETAITRACKKMEHTHFSRVDLVTAEGILVGTHLGSIAGRTCRCLMIQPDPWESG